MSDTLGGVLGHIHANSEEGLTSRRRWVLIQQYPARKLQEFDQSLGALELTGNALLLLQSEEV